MTKKRLEKIQQNEMSKHIDVKKHTAGNVPQFYPMNQVALMLDGHQQEARMSMGNERYSSARNAVKAVHRDSQG